MMSHSVVKKTHDSAIFFLFVKYRTVDDYYVDKSNSLHCVRFNSGYASNNDQPANVLKHVLNFFLLPDWALEHYFFIDVLECRLYVSSE
jgi:hypothetical protein